MESREALSQCGLGMTMRGTGATPLSKMGRPPMVLDGFLVISKFIPVLVSARTFALSPFGGNTIFVGGHDCCGISSDEMAWTFKGSMEGVLDQRGIERGE